MISVARKLHHGTALLPQVPYPELKANRASPGGRGGRSSKKIENHGKPLLGNSVAELQS